MDIDQFNSSATIHRPVKPLRLNDAPVDKRVRRTISDDVDDAECRVLK